MAKPFSYNKRWTSPEKATVLLWNLNNIIKSCDSTIPDRSNAKVVLYDSALFSFFSIHLKNVNFISSSGAKIRAYPFSLFRQRKKNKKGHKLHYSRNAALVGRWRRPEEKRSYLDVWWSWEPGALVPRPFAFPVTYCKTTVPCPTTTEIHSNTTLFYNNYLRNSSILKWFSQTPGHLHVVAKQRKGVILLTLTLLFFGINHFTSKILTMLCVSSVEDCTESL